jgi:uncharacterized membrane protein YphA (DoxX/SURF4 family)
MLGFAGGYLRIWYRQPGFRVSRENPLQRLFSTFPGGWPGVALLLLRVTIGVTSAAQGAFYLPHDGTWTLGPLFACLLLGISGACLLIGFLTPYVSGLIGVGSIASATSWFPTPTGSLLDGKVASLEMIVMAVAVALLGPGAFSVDARLFGRREIVIPPPTARPKS